MRKNLDQAVHGVSGLPITVKLAGIALRIIWNLINVLAAHMAVEPMGTPRTVQLDGMTLEWLKITVTVALGGVEPMGTPRTAQLDGMRKKRKK